jgi:hypothetical protein
LRLRDRILKAVSEGDLEAIEVIVTDEPRSVRYLVGLMYRPDENIRKIGARGIALASRKHPRVVKKIILRLIWAMNEESCTFIPTAPEVLRAIADEKPELLVPVAPDIVRLCKDTSLNQGLCDTLRRVAEQCPGEIAQGLTKVLSRRVR